MAEGSTKKGINAFDEGQTAQEIQAVKTVIAAFLRAVKNYAIYPEDHVVCQESLQTVMTHLNTFLNNYGDLRFNVEKDGLLFHGESVQKDDPHKGELSFPLFRDGIQWFEFQEGIELSELSGFFKIIDQYKRLQEEAKGDLVTALWEMNFPHFRYSATDVLFKAEVVSDFSVFSVTDTGQYGLTADGTTGAADHKVAPDTAQDSVAQEEPDDAQDGSTDTAGEQASGADIALSAMDNSTWELTPEEFQHLEEMVAEEENRDSTEDALDILILILQTQNNPEDYANILEFIKEEFKDTLAQGEFQIALNSLKRLKKIYQSCETEKTWAQPLLDRFFVDISDAQVLKALHQILPTLDKQHDDQIKALRQLLLILPPSTITALAPILLKEISKTVERQLLEIIGSLALRDITPLKNLLDRPEETLVKKLVYVLGHIKGEKTQRILLKMTRHASGRVRLEALKALTRQDENLTRQLFSLIDDPILPIRQLMWNYLEQHKDEASAELILDYLARKKFIRGDERQVTNCYKMLGAYGPDRFLPFLRKSLLDRGWDFSSDRSLRRQGAALALFELNTAETQGILEKASKSLSPGVRSAYQKALKDHQ